MIGVKDNKVDKRNKFIPYMAAFSLFLILGFSVAFTQRLAFRWGYHPSLGEPIFGNVYSPFKFIEWIKTYLGSNHEEILSASFEVGAITGAFAAFGFFGIAIFTRKTHAVSTLHGSAKWAGMDDIERAGLFRSKESNQPSVYVGAWKDKEGKTRYLTHSGPEHILALAPTRSGKGIGLIIPTLLAWTDSAVVYDLKGENYALSSGWRKSIGQKIYKFDPMDKTGTTARYNPLAEARIGTLDEVADVQNIANMIVDPDGNGLHTHWDKTSFAFLTGVILHVCHSKRREGRTATLADVARAMSGEEGIDALYFEMKTNKFNNGEPHETIQRAAIDMLDRDERERGSALSTTKTFFSLYTDPVVAQNTSCSDFTARSLMNDDQPSTLYLVIDPSNQERLRPIVRLMITQILRNNTPRLIIKDGRPVKHYKHRLLMLLDEFPALKKLPIVTESIATVAGYGIKFYIFIQDMMQLYDAYGDKESITSNSHIRVAYAPNKYETAELLSKWTGTTTVLDLKSSISGKRAGLMLSQTTETQEHYSRPLLTPDECMRLPGARKDSDGMVKEPGDMLIFSAGFPPIYGKQILFFLDPTFSKRSRIPAPTQSDRS